MKDSDGVKPEALHSNLLTEVLYQHETPVRTGLASFVIEPGGRVWVIWRNDFFVINPTPLEWVPPKPQLVVKAFITS